MQVANEEATPGTDRKSTLDASVLGLGGGAVPSLGGGAMNLASLLGGGGLQTQMNPLASVLGGTTGLLGTSGVPNELAGLCALLGKLPTKSQCVSHKLASCGITEGCGCTEARYGAASGCSCTS